MPHIPKVGKTVNVNIVRYAGKKLYIPRKIRYDKRDYLQRMQCYG